MQSKTKIIGLTGNSGSGKTTVSKILQEKKIPVIDCDKIAHDVLTQGTPCYFDLINYFGKNILDDMRNINRKVLGNLVFNDKHKLMKLNEITHFYIISIVLNKIDEILSLNQTYKYIVIDAPILIGTRLEKIVDEVWVVYSDYNTVISRLLQRDSISLQQIEDRLKNQIDVNQLKNHAHFLIENNGSVEELRDKVLKYL